jgi:hypothetical protein
MYKNSDFNEIIRDRPEWDPEWDPEWAEPEWAEPEWAAGPEWKGTDPNGTIS